MSIIFDIILFVGCHKMPQLSSSWRAIQRQSVFFSAYLLFRRVLFHVIDLSKFYFDLPGSALLAAELKFEICPQAVKSCRSRAWNVAGGAWQWGTAQESCASRELSVALPGDAACLTKEGLKEEGSLNCSLWNSLKRITIFLIHLHWNLKLLKCFFKKTLIYK